MSTRLIVDDSSELKEVALPENSKQPVALRFAARLLSFLFHPLFIPVYLSWFLVRIQPYLFAGFNEWDKTVVMIRFAAMYSLFPLVTVLLAKALGFIDSVYLRTQKDRIIPYIACGLYYFWMWYVLRNQSQFPSVIVTLSMAIFIASSLGLMANIYMKVSMHAISMGVMVAFMMNLAFTQDINMGFYLSVAIFIAGLVCTARFIDSDHTGMEVYGGLAIGVISQIIAMQIS